MSTIETWYVAGPMTGYPDANYAAFDAEEQRLLAWGRRVISPVQMNRQHGVPGSVAGAVSTGPEHFHTCMRRDFAAILDECVGLVLLEGWEKSTGAFMEITLAVGIGLEIRYAETYELVPAEVLQAHLKMPGYHQPTEEAAA